MTENGVTVPVTYLEQRMDAAKLGRTVRDVPVCHVIENPAKGVQFGCITPHGWTQKPTGPKETLAARRENLLRLVEVVFLFQPLHPMLTSLSML